MGLFGSDPHLSGHNHPCPINTKVSTQQLSLQIKETVEKDPTITAGKLVSGYDLNNLPAAFSLVEANAQTIAQVRKRFLVNEETMNASVDYVDHVVL